MIPFTIELEDFKNYINKEVLASGSYSKGRKTLERYTSFDEQKNEFMSCIHIISTLKDVEGYQKTNVVKTIEEAIEKFNSII